MKNDGRGENVKFENLAWLAGWIKIFNQAVMTSSDSREWELYLKVIIQKYQGHGMRIYFIIRLERHMQVCKLARYVKDDNFSLLF